MCLHRLTPTALRVLPHRPRAHVGVRVRAGGDEFGVLRAENEALRLENELLRVQPARDNARAAILDVYGVKLR